MFRFTVLHVPGKKNVTADAFSRRYDSPAARHHRTRTMEAQTLLPGYSDKLGPPSWVSHPSPVTKTEQKEDGTKVHPIPASLAFLHAAPVLCEVQLAPEHIFVGHIMSCISEVNSWSRIDQITSDLSPEALSWQKLEAACQNCDIYKLLLRTVQTGSDKKPILHPKS